MIASVRFIIMSCKENVKFERAAFVQSTQNGIIRKNELYFLTKKVL